MSKILNVEKEETYFIPGNVPSSKNSKRKFKNVILWSKPAEKYRKESAEYYREIREVFRNRGKPIIVGFYFVKKTRNKFDFPNPLQTVLDLMVQNGVIDDDNINEIIPIPMKIDNNWYEVDKDNHGVYIKIFEENEI